MRGGVSRDAWAGALREMRAGSRASGGEADGRTMELVEVRMTPRKGFRVSLVIA